MVHLGAFAQSPDSFASTKWSYQLGSDAWALDASKKKDTEKSYVEDNSNLLLPNSYTQWPYQDVSGYGRLTGSLQLGSGVEASVKVRADQTIGFRVDEAFAQKNISPFFGIRAGVVDYKTSWCRTYESDTVWIREVEVICNTPQFRDVTGGAPGVQIVINNTAGNYLIQSQAGIYRPLLLDFAPKEFGNVVPGADYRVDRNDKLGLNVNLVNLETALEARVSYIQAIQSAYSPELQGTTKQASDLIYIGLSFPFSSRVNVRGTHVLQLLQNTCRSEDATLAMGSACNLNRNDRKTSTSLEIIYQVGVTDVVSLGVNEFNLSSQQTLFNSTLDVYAQADLFSIKSRQISMAWRRDWGNGYYSVVQVLESEQKTQSQSSSYPSNGWGLGLRLGYQF